MDFFIGGDRAFKLARTTKSYNLEFCRLFYEFFFWHFSDFQQRDDAQTVGIINPCALHDSLLINVSLHNPVYDFTIKLFTKAYFVEKIGISLTLNQQNQIKEFITDLDLDWEF